MMMRLFLGLVLSVVSGFMPRHIPLAARSVKSASMPSLLTAAEKAVVMQKVGEEVYKPIFAAGLGIVGVSIVSIVIVALLIDANDGYEELASDFQAQGIADLEKEFGKDATKKALEGTVRREENTAFTSSAETLQENAPTYVKKETVTTGSLADDGYDD